ncbi:MAG: class I SAM-dependent methyltransferase [Candidatus Limnocylindrales bacterium]
MSLFESGTDAYGRFVGRYGPPLAVVHADAAGVVASDRALDVGCGPGALLAELARRLGPSRVVGVDPSRPFVELARAAVPGADVQLASAEDLPFDDGAFDVVMSQLVVSFMTDAVGGVSEMRRVARRTVASCVWDYAGQMTMLRTFWDAVLELDPDAPDEARSMPYASRDQLHALWQRCGLRAVTTGQLVAGADYADFDDFWTPFLAGIGPAGAYVATLDAERRGALRAACFRRLGAPVGPFHLDARAWFVRGEV